MHPLMAVVLSYVVGSIPSAYLAGKMHGVDLRKHGSGNLGATNVMRVLGARIGLAVFAVDMAKGALPVLFFPGWSRPGALAALSPTGWPLLLAILCGVAAIVGHVRPVFLRFGRGGKGVATAGGVFVALAPVQTLLTLLVFAVVVLCSGYVSLGSLISAVLLPVLLAVTVGVASPLFVIALLVAAFVFWTHRANIGRLRRGEEHRFGKKGIRARRPAIAVAITVAVVAAVLVAARFA